MTDNEKSAHTTYHFSLIREHWSASENSTPQPLELSHPSSHCVLFVITGSLSVDGKALNSGYGRYMKNGMSLSNESDTEAVTLLFVVSPQSEIFKPADSIDRTSERAQGASINNREVLLCQSFETELKRGILRLDQVDFPPGAIAYNHTHPGAGIRYLVKGGLEIKSSHDVQNISTGNAWFEESNSPVQATAVEDGSSQFIRAMLLPSEFEGKPTLQLVNPEDATKPRLQTNTRHVEQSVAIDHFHDADLT